MTEQQWQQLVDVVNGRTTTAPVGFIIDSPWLPAWAGVSIMDYFANDADWLEANLKALELDDNFAVAHNNLAVAYLENDDFEKAVPHCDRAVALGYDVAPEILAEIEPHRK